MRDCESCKNHTDKGCTKWKCEFEPTIKNDLGVDCISRTEVLNLIYDYKENHSENRKEYPINYGTLLDMIRWIRKLPSVTPQPMVVSIAEIKYDKDKLKELVNRAVLTVAPQELQIFKWCDTCREYDQEKHCCHRWSKVIRDTVEEMKQEQEPRWIPVSEYLPVTNDEVLVTYIVNGNAKKRYVKTANCFDGEWSSVNDEYRIPNTKIEIIAWCEMPKPYKAEVESQESEDKE